MEKFENILKIMDIKKIFLISLLSIIGLAIRITIIPFDVPLSLDSLSYYSFAYTIITELTYPENLDTNDGWSWFLSLFFVPFANTDFLFLNGLQRILSSVISVICCIPLYLLLKKFVNSNFALIGITLFIFEPRMIINSSLGITEPLYILCIIIVMYFLTSNKSNKYIISFVVLGFSTLVRYESLLFLIPLIIIYFIKFQINLKKIKNLILGILFFVLIITSVGSLRQEQTGMDGITSHVIGGAQYIDDYTNDENPEKKLSNNNSLMTFIEKSAFNLLKYLAWITFPIFFIFIPFGIYNFFKYRKKELIYLLIFNIFMIIPGLYAYGREIQEIRYLLPIVPFISLISILSFDKFKIMRKQFVLSIIIILIIISSVLFLNIKTENNDEIREKYELAKKLTNYVGGINEYPGANLLKPAELEVNWPKNLKTDENRKITTGIKRIETEPYQNPYEFIKNERKSGLTHIVILNNNLEFFNDIIVNPENYKYLEKTMELNYKKIGKVTIYQINYQAFDDFLNKSFIIIN